MLIILIVCNYANYTNSMLIILLFRHAMRWNSTYRDKLLLSSTALLRKLTIGENLPRLALKLW